MNNETQNEIEGEEQEHVLKKTSTLKVDKYLVPIAIVMSGVIIAAAITYRTGDVSFRSQNNTALEDVVLPSGGVELPVIWGDLGSKLVESGAIDADKMQAIYEERGLWSDEYRSLLLGQNNGNLKITQDNSGYLLNLLWALGLSQKNKVLDEGEMSNPQFGGAQNFASTAGWTIARGNAMNHYSSHMFFELTPEQEALVDRISRGIYRPCCGNSTHFPDCNHGMAMLGLLELMASQGVNEQDMWDAALVANSYWFPENYLTIAEYMNNNGVSWNKISAEKILGGEFSSSQGYSAIASQVVARQSTGGGSGCGIDTGVQRKQSSGCGI